MSDIRVSSKLPPRRLVVSLRSVTRSSTSKGSPFWMPGRRKPRTITNDQLRVASRRLGFSTPRRCISAMSIARCGEGSGSLPVPCRPATSPTASTRTGNMPKGTARSPTVCGWSSGESAATFGLLGESRFHEEQPANGAGAQKDAQEEEGASFHASIDRKEGRGEKQRLIWGRNNSNLAARSQERQVRISRITQMPQVTELVREAGPPPSGPCVRGWRWPDSPGLQRMPCAAPYDSAPGPLAVFRGVPARWRN